MSTDTTSRESIKVLVRSALSLHIPKLDDAFAPVSPNSDEADAAYIVDIHLKTDGRINVVCGASMDSCRADDFADDVVAGDTAPSPSSLKTHVWQSRDLCANAAKSFGSWSVGAVTSLSQALASRQRSEHPRHGQEDEQEENTEQTSAATLSSPVSRQHPRWRGGALAEEDGDDDHASCTSGSTLFDYHDEDHCAEHDWQSTDTLVHSDILTCDSEYAGMEGATNSSQAKERCQGRGLDLCSDMRNCGKAHGQRMAGTNKPADKCREPTSPKRDPGARRTWPFLTPRV